jgi:hypothetical protein
VLGAAVKISLLQQREDFAGVFVSSLSDFLAAYFGRSVMVAPAGAGSLSFRQNAALNVVYPKALPPRCLTPLTAEFRYADRVIKRWLQTAYCVLAVRPPLSSLASPVAFDLVDAPREVASWVFLPGNHTVRVIDTTRNQSIVFLKEGFDRAFFLRDAQARLSHPFLPAPRVLEIDERQRWYREERVTGLPLNRLANPGHIKASLGGAVAALAGLREKTSHSVPLQVWAAERVVEIQGLCHQLHGKILRTAPVIEGLLRSAEAVIASTQPAPITLCEVHGDFQPANILTDGRNTWIIDWEYSGIRTATYDFFVYSTRSRFSHGLHSRLADTLKVVACDQGINAWGFFQPGAAPALLTVFLLEDLTLKLREVTAPAIRDKEGSLLSWTCEAGSFLRELEAQVASMST